MKSQNEEKTALDCDLRVADRCKVNDALFADASLMLDEKYIDSVNEFE